MNKRVRAFTLIELMVVILILAILAALIVPNVLSRQGKAKVTKATADVAEITSAIDNFRLDCDRYPTQQEGFSVLFTNSSSITGWNGPYLKNQIPEDPWGHDYVYQVPGPNGGGYEVLSYGSDGTAGGTGDAADIANGSDT